jgi:hypothetical protein
MKGNLCVNFSGKANKKNKTNSVKNEHCDATTRAVTRTRRAEKGGMSRQVFDSALTKEWDGMG